MILFNTSAITLIIMILFNTNGIHLIDNNNTCQYKCYIPLIIIVEFSIQMLLLHHIDNNDTFQYKCYHIDNNDT